MGEGIHVGLGADGLEIVVDSGFKGETYYFLEKGGRWRDGVVAGEQSPVGLVEEGSCDDSFGFSVLKSYKIFGVSEVRGQGNREVGRFTGGFEECLGGGHGFWWFVGGLEL